MPVDTTSLIADLKVAIKEAQALIDEKKPIEEIDAALERVKEARARAVGWLSSSPFSLL
ncbi:MAG: hypothetical protein OYH77_06375 [Pseudomonadota bacterium]|nr:hypothetical protein [Pseudomonadota bacterium]